nr:ferritin [candidate division Zixibacteria bacterium]
MNKKIEKAFNDQINEELFSYYLYLSMSAWFSTKNFEGFAAWMKAQAKEEMVHAMKFFDHIQERGGTVKLQPIKGPKTEWKSPLEAFQESLKHEKHITGCIEKLVKLSMAENDFASNSMLNWFIDEQVEEEASVGLMVEHMKMVSDSTGALFMMDREAGKRGAAK